MGSYSTMGDSSVHPIISFQFFTPVSFLMLQYVNQRQVKWQKQVRANLHYQYRLLSAVICGWKVGDAEISYRQ